MTAFILRHRRAVYCISLAACVIGLAVDVYGFSRFGWI